MKEQTKLRTCSGHLWASLVEAVLFPDSVWALHGVFRLASGELMQVELLRDAVKFHGKDMLLQTDLQV